MTQSQTKEKMPFRTDINALRALAVLSVVFYHFQTPGFAGGYVGVDVFYVISGFLMTQIIAGRLGQGGFTLTGFYAARARRIIPALVVLVLALLAAGWFFLIPSDYRLLGSHSFSALTFTSNISFSGKDGYFDAVAQEKWLLHSWSLSVEAQFYMLYPLMLIGLHKFRNGLYMKKGVVAVFILSLALSVFGTAADQSRAFFQLPFRAWELMAGGLVYFYGARLAGKYHLDKLGLLMILYGVFFYSDALIYPGAFALLPVVGAMLMLAAVPKNALFDSRPVQFFGDISYSLYLWHWPVILVARYLELDITPVSATVMLALMLGLSCASYQWVEKPFRKKGDDRKALIKLCGASAGFAGLAYLIFSLSGVPQRVAPEVLSADRTAKDSNPRQGACLADGGKKPAPCKLGTDAAPSVALWGDSHADAIFTVFGDALTAADRGGLFFGSSGCPPVLGAERAVNAARFGKNWKSDACKYFNEESLGKILADKNIRDVYLLSRWSSYIHGHENRDGAQPYIVFGPGIVADAANLPARAKEFSDKLVETACTLTKNGKQVYVIAPIPEMQGHVPAMLAKSRLLYHKDPEIGITTAHYTERHKTILSAMAEAEKQCGARIVDPRRALCTAEECSALGAENESLYRDYNHLSEKGSQRLKPILTEALRQ